MILKIVIVVLAQLTAVNMSKQTTINPRTGKRVVVKKTPTTPIPNPILPFLDLPLDHHLFSVADDEMDNRMQTVVSILWARMAAVEKENAELRAFRDEVLRKEEAARIKEEEALAREEAREREEWHRDNYPAMPPHY